MDKVGSVDLDYQTGFGNEFSTEVLVASARSTHHIVESAKLGANVVTIPPSTFRQLFKHPLTENGLKAFLDDWASTGQSIL